MRSEIDERDRALRSLGERGAATEISEEEAGDAWRILGVVYGVLLMVTCTVIILATISWTNRQLNERNLHEQTKRNAASNNSCAGSGGCRKRGITPNDPEP